MTLARAYSVCACATMVLGITTYAAATDSPGLAVFAVPVSIVAWIASSGPRPLRLPTLAVHVGLAAVVLYGLVRALRTGVDIEGLANIVVALLLLKLADRRSTRDDGQVLTMAVFLAIAAMLNEQGLLVGLQLLLLIPLLTCSVMLFQLMRTRERALGDARSAPVVAGRRFARHLRRTAAASVIVIVAVSAVVFLVMPRNVLAGAAGDVGRPTSRRQVGFNDQIQLGRRGVISDSTEVVFETAIRDNDGTPLAAPDRHWYLRGAALDVYSAGGWRMREGNRTDPPPVQQVGGLDPPDPDAIGDLVEQTLYLRLARDQRTYIHLLSNPVLITAAASQPTGRRDPARIVEIPHLVASGTVNVWFDQQRGTLRLAAAEPGSLVVRAWCDPDRRPSPAAWREPVDAGSLSVRDLTRLHERAAEIAQRAGLDPDPQTRPTADDRALAEAIRRSFLSGYAYTLEERATPVGVDPTIHFLFSTRAGHCEYYASAMTLMCRALGINARVVTGYVATEHDPATDRYVIRRNDAHAWVEIPAGGGAWLALDPTPPTALDRYHRPRREWLGGLQSALDRLSAAWTDAIVTFDEHDQRRIFGGSARVRGRIGRGLDDLADRLRRTSADDSRSPLRGPIATVIALVVFVTSGAFVLTRLIALISTRSARRAPRRHRSHALLPFYAQLLRTLEKWGHAKPDSVPPLLHAGSLPAGPGADAARLVALFYEVRFGGRPLTPEVRAQARTLVRAVESGLRARRTT